MPPYLKYSLFYFLSLIIFLGLPQMGGSSEAREAHIVSVIVRDNEWILPTRNGLIPSKPPFFHWLAASFNMTPLADIFDKDFIARLPSAIFASLSLLLALLITRHLSRQIPNLKDSDVQLMSTIAVILISTYGFTSMAQRSMVDMTFAFFTFLASFFIIRKIYLQGNGQLELKLTDFDLLMFFVASAFAVLSKGPLGLILPVINLLAIASVCSFKSVFKKLIRPHYSWIVFILIALPWYLLAIEYGGNAFIDRQLMLENIDRFMGEETAKPFWFYLPAFIGQAFPWSIIVLLFLINKLKPKLFQKFKFSSDRILQPLLYIFVAGFVFFSISGGKRASYLLPLYPYLSIWLGLQLCLNFENFKESFKRRQNMFRIISLIVWLIILVIYCCTGFSFAVSSKYLKIAEVAWKGYLIPVVFLTLFSIVAYIRKTPFIIHSFLLFMAFLCLTQSAAAFKWQIKGYRETAAAITKLFGREIAVIKTPKDEYFDSLLYYLNHPVKLLDPDKADFKGQKYLIAKQSYVNDNPEIFKDLPEPKYLLAESNYANKVLKEDMLLFKISGSSIP